MHDKIKLTEKIFEQLGFDISKEPYTCNMYTVYKNYRRDASGTYDGYLITDLKGNLHTVRTLQDFIYELDLLDKIEWDREARNFILAN